MFKGHLDWPFAYNSHCQPVSMWLLMAKKVKLGVSIIFKCHFFLMKLVGVVLCGISQSPCLSITKVVRTGTSLFHDLVQNFSIPDGIPSLVLPT